MATRDLRTPSILLVSNSVDERQAYTRALRASGYRVVNAATTILAYQIAITRPTDIVVTEGHFAGSMSGLELTRRLRIHTRTTTVPIIVITSETRRQDGELSIKAGADMFLEKPGIGRCATRTRGTATRGVRASPAPVVAEARRSSRHGANVPAMSWTHGVSAQVAGPLGGGSEQSRATIPIALCVRLVLHRPGVRVPGVSAAQGITR
jgi:PleD family two-component response regulator